MSNITAANEIFIPRYNRLIDIYNQSERSHWVSDEADMSVDVTQWKDGSLTDAQKRYIKMILRFFTQADTNVCGGYVEKLLPVFKNADARIMLLSFASRETVHIFGYRRLNDTLGYDSEEFMSEFLDYEALKAKHDFMIEETDLRSNKNRAEYLGKQILIEGVNLFASFAQLLDFSRLNLLPGMVSVNKWSLVDESQHIEGLTELFKIFLEENPSVVTEEFKKTLYETARKVVSLEDDTIDLCYSIDVPKLLDKQDLKNYIRYVCDYRMQQMGFKPQFDVTTNPLPFIETITGDGVFGNFFETTITAYSKDSLTGEWEY